MNMTDDKACNKFRTIKGFLNGEGLSLIALWCSSAHHVSSSNPNCFPSFIVVTIILLSNRFYSIAWTGDMKEELCICAT
jgi:hypothetical protein